MTQTLSSDIKELAVHTIVLYHGSPTQTFATRPCDLSPDPD
jgi:hypothetical protein